MAAARRLLEMDEEEDDVEEKNEEEKDDKRGSRSTETGVDRFNMSGKKEQGCQKKEPSRGSSGEGGKVASSSLLYGQSIRFSTNNSHLYSITYG